MRRLPSLALLACIPLVSVSLAHADRTFSTMRPEVPALERPERTPVTRPEVYRTTDVGQDRCGPYSGCGQAARPERREVQSPVSQDEVRHGRPALRPDPRREFANPVDDAGTQRSLDGTEVRHGRPALRPDPKRDTFLPADEAGNPRFPTGTEVRHGAPAMRPDPKRQLTNEVDEMAPQRSLDGTEIRQGKPFLRPDPKRDTFKPVDEGGASCVDATLCP